jgi:hypothetical protein
MGGGQIFLKPSAPLSLMKTYRMSLILAGSISLDSTFNTYGMGGWDCQLYVQDVVFCQLSSKEAAIYLSYSYSLYAVGAI